MEYTATKICKHVRQIVFRTKKYVNIKNDSRIIQRQWMILVDVVRMKELIQEIFHSQL